MDRWTDFVQMHHIDEHTEPRASAVTSLGEDVWCIWGQEILPIWPDTWTCSPWRWYMVTTDTAELVNQAIATLRNVISKYRLSSPWTTLLSEFSEWVGSSWLIGSDLIWYFGDELLHLAHALLDWWCLAQYKIQVFSWGFDTTCCLAPPQAWPPAFRMNATVPVAAITPGRARCELVGCLGKILST